MKYEAPFITVEELNSADVVMISGVTVGDSGELGIIDWSELNK